MIIAMRASIAGEGSTEPNLYFACGKMQTDPSFSAKKRPPLWWSFLFSFFGNEGFQIDLMIIFDRCYFILFQDSLIQVDAV